MRRTSRSIACSLLLVFTGASDATFSGIGRAKDGDSLMVGNREVRLFGIDAPEYSQRCTRGDVQWSCGAQATERLSALVSGREVRCRQISTDQYQRTVAKCSVGGTDINAAMTESGFAVAYRRYSSDYVAAEEHAKSAKRGLWSGTFEAPREYRQEERGLARPVSVRSGRRHSAPARASVSSSCDIKGNQNRRGQWIYHLPGMPYYEQTHAEQMFCTEAEAQAAGYRRAIVR